MKLKSILISLMFSTFLFSQKKWNLSECVRSALEKNLIVQQANLNAKISSIEVANAKANFMPTLNASTGTRLNMGSTFDPVSNNRVSMTTVGGSLGLNSNVVLFNGFRNTNMYRLAKLGVTEASLDLKLIQNDISLQVVNLYLNILFAKENLAVAEQQLLISKEQLKRIKEQFDLGAVSKGELLNIKSTVANSLQVSVAAQNNLQAALFSLAQLIQVSPLDFEIASINTDIVLDAELMYKDYQIIYEKALQDFPEIQKAKLQVEQSDLNIKIAEAAYYPTVNLSANLGTNYGFNLDLPKGLENKSLGEQLNNNLGYGFNVGISIPIFTGFRNRNNVRRSIINKDISKKRVDGQRLELKRKIQQAYIDAKLALNTYNTSKTVLEVQEETFNNAKLSLEYGTLTMFDFEQVRARLVQAQSSLIRAKYDYLFKTKVLKFYFGENIMSGK